MTAPAGGLYFLSVDYGILLEVPEPHGGTIPGGAARTGPIAL
jgi:hypothetical protein